ncbi:MAG: hypothetical protein KGD70_05340 [Candidatus Lokiarchaeota archaeon]|nr:hypothetical protein [Candidatus Lokiarchaeota archaeon]
MTIPRKKQKIKFSRKFACKHLTSIEDIANSLQPLCYCPERDLILGKKAYVCQVCTLYVQTSQKVSDVFEESRKGAEKKIKEKKIELEAFELAELKGDNDLDLTIDEFEEEEDEEVTLKFEKRKLVKDEIGDSEEFTEVECPFCAELYDDLRSHLPNCEFAPEDASIEDIMPSRKKKKKAKPKTTSGTDTKEKKVCPYCGKEFVRLGRHLSSCPKKPEDAKEKEEEGEEEDDEEVEEDDEDDEDDEEEDD